MKIRHTSKILTSLLAVVSCFAMLIGSTYAWFTDSSMSGSNLIQSGNIDVVVEYTLDGENWNDLDGATDLFQKGLWEPGHTEVVALKIKNNGSLALKYAAKMNVVKETLGKTKDGTDIKLSDVLTVSTLVQEKNDVGEIALMLAFMGQNAIAYEQTSTFNNANVLHKDQELLPNSEHYLIVKVDMADDLGNEFNHNGVDIPTIEFGINVLATQFTYENDTFGNQYDKDSGVDKWDGTVDISWYLENPDASTFNIDSAEALAGLAVLIDGKGKDYLPETYSATENSLDLSEVSFEAQKIILQSDVDLYVKGENGEPTCFDPIGSYRNEQAFKGIFDGNGYTIRNLYQNTWALNNGYYYGDLGLGLFGYIEDATIRNVKIDGASISGESGLVGIVAATAYGDCTFENITVTNSKANDYQYYAGGVVGWASGNHTYSNITIDKSTTIGSQWGDFGNANGGIIGGIGSSAKILFKDCTVACRIDAVNDVVSAYQWYNYRNSGMLIGRVPQTITNGEEQTVKTPTDNVTCENVTVIYGDWANYTYCEFAGTGYPYVRVQAGVSVDGYSNVRYGHPTDANGKTVVDDNHVHNDGEDHQVLIAFDQLFGGPAEHRYCYYGIAEYPGVTVDYNNK